MSTEEKKQATLPNRQFPFSEAFKSFIAVDWAPDSGDLPDPVPASTWTPARRAALAAEFPGERLIIPAGGLRVRSNDVDYPYRAYTAFAYLTGLEGDREPDAVLVLEPTDNGHEPTMYFRPRAPRTDPEFYSSSRYGELWVGRRESLDEMSAMVGFRCADIAGLEDAIAKNADSTAIRLIRDVDESLNSLVDVIRVSAGIDADDPEVEDAELCHRASEMRLIKDEFEVDEMRRAVSATIEGFEAVVAELPQAVAAGRGERWVEGVFGLHARHRGNDVGYGTIAASGDHACTLHWVRNDGSLANGDLILMDAGVEVDTLYTADITRTLPVNGRFSPEQRMVYEAVLEAQAAGIAAAKPGAKFADVHNAAIRVIARRLHDWGILPVTVRTSLSKAGGQHRRWMVHGTSHHLGMDVHDCAWARDELYRGGVLEPGMIITVEPGIYLQPNDELVPPELRGIGVRIEDDVLITADGNEVLSAALPKQPDQVEAWMAAIWAKNA